MHKGIVMEVTGKHWIVMTPEGEFLQVPIQKTSVIPGDEVLINRVEKKENRSPWWWQRGKALWMAGGAVAAAVMVFLLLPFTTAPVAHAQTYVYIDLNPSVELGLDQNRDVVQVRALNSEAQELIQGVDWKGHEVKEVVVDLLNRAKQARYLEHEERVIISEVPAREGASVSPESLTQIKEEVKQNAGLNHAHLDLYTLPFPDELKKKAKESDISPTKYAVGLIGRRQGKAITIAQLKEMSITDLMKEVNMTPYLQNPPSDEEWLVWMEEEEDGLKQESDVEEKKPSGEKEEKERIEKETTPASGMPEDVPKEDLPSESSTPSAPKESPHPESNQGDPPPAPTEEEKPAVTDPPTSEKEKDPAGKEGEPESLSDNSVIEKVSVEKTE